MGRQVCRQARKFNQIYILYFGESTLVSAETYCLELWVDGQIKIELINS